MTWQFKGSVAFMELTLHYLEFLFFCHYTLFRGSKTVLLCKSRGQAVQIPLWKLPEMGSSCGIPKPNDLCEVWAGYLPTS